MSSDGFSTEECRELYKICRNTLKGTDLWEVCFPRPKTKEEIQELKEIWDIVDNLNTLFEPKDIYASIKRP